MDIKAKKEFVRVKKKEVPSHIIEIGLNLLYVEPHNMEERLKELDVLKQINLEDIFSYESGSVMIDIFEHPYNEELDNIGFAKQLSPDLAVVVKDIILEEYQIFLNRIYQVDGIAFPITHLTKKATEKFMFIMSSMGMMPIPIVDNNEDLEKIPDDLTRVIVFNKNYNGKPKIKDKICFKIDNEGNLVKC